MFFWIRYIEEIGTGTNKIIHKNISQNQAQERENRIVKLLLKQEKITSGEIQEIYSVTRDTANRYLKKLIDLKIIERKGRGRFVYYVLREK